MPTEAEARRRAPVIEQDLDDWEQNFLPLSAEEARRWRAAQPRACLGCVLAAQIICGALAVLVAALITGRSAVAWSVAYGALAVVVPTVFFLRRARRRFRLATSALLNLLFAELVKIVLTLLLLAFAPRLVPGVSWPAMLAGVIVVLQGYWLGLMWMGVRMTRKTGRGAQGATTAGAGAQATYGMKDAHGC